MGRLHEAEVLAEHGEIAEAYVRSQIMTKAFEAIGLPYLSIWERAVAIDGTVLDFDGRPMHEKTAAALDAPVADFEYRRRLIEHHTQIEILDKMQPGQAIAEDSKHPDVDDDLAAVHGYHPELRYLMKRLYRRSEDSLILFNYTVLQGYGEEGITQREVHGDTTIGELLASHDPDTDYSEIDQAREWLEEEAQPYIDDFVKIVEDVGWQLKNGIMEEAVAVELLDEYERGFLTLLLVKFNPERAAGLITAEDLAWARSLLDHSPGEVLLAAADISNRNELEWIACGGLLAAMLGGNSWHGGEIKQGVCVNCKLGPQPVGRESWCEPCIKGHCG